MNITLFLILFINYFFIFKINLLIILDILFLFNNLEQIIFICYL
jgi:hypothetical protein